MVKVCLNENVSPHYGKGHSQSPYGVKSGRKAWNMEIKAVKAKELQSMLNGSREIRILNSSENFSPCG